MTTGLKFDLAYLALRGVYSLPPNLAADLAADKSLATALATAEAADEPLDDTTFLKLLKATN